MTRLKRFGSIAYNVINDPRKVFGLMIADFLVASMLYWWIEGTGPIASMWWAIVTGTTTGYGDYSPHTTLGRGVAVVFMLSMFFLLLCFGAHLTRLVLVDPDAFTDAEQRELMAKVGSILNVLEGHSMVVDPEALALAVHNARRCNCDSGEGDRMVADEIIEQMNWARGGKHV